VFLAAFRLDRRKAAALDGASNFFAAGCYSCESDRGAAPAPLHFSLGGALRVSLCTALDRIDLIALAATQAAPALWETASCEAGMS
jgi:hypothetical protein